ncbi:MAG: uroporphyrinogen decarboxylase [Thermoguttaceae bacterium]
MSTPAWLDSPLMKAARREPAPHTPIWLMRQAGRYLPDYRKLREHTSFLDLCKNPDLCAETAITTAEWLGVDAAILFSDLLLILEPMGLRLEFSAGEGPNLENAIRVAADVDRLVELESIEPLGFVVEAVRKTRAGLRPSLPLIGFAGAPFTLAAYAIEGGASRDYRRTKTLMYTDTGVWDALMGRLARAVTLYLKAQLDAGCQLVQLFDSWAGCLGPDDYRRYVLPHTRSVIESLPAGVPVIHFATGNAALLPLLAEAFGKKKRPAVVGVDWRIRLEDAWRAVGPDRAIQGNLDPVVLLSNPLEIRRRAKDVLRQAGDRPGHIFNLGHGVLPQTPPENALALIEAVHELSGR